MPAKRLLLLLLLAVAAPARGEIASWSDVRLDGGAVRGPIELRVTAPVAGRGLPLLLFSHGNFLSKDDYAPLATRWAAAGFVVVQPTHLDARVRALADDDPRRGTIWRARRDDLVAVLDHWAEIERQVPGLAGRVVHTSALAAGHSYGGHTVELLLGARVDNEDLSDRRIIAGLLLAPPGPFEDLVPDWQARAPYLALDDSAVRAPVLVVVGDQDRTPMTTRDYTWRTEPARRLRDACLVTVPGADHYLGGIAGTARELSNPDVLAAVAGRTIAWLHAPARCPAR
jgi:predicted dienelactone hydrolase